jgi:hypothetical protein
MMEWLTLFSVGLFLTIRIIKKKIDLPPPPNESDSDSAGVQYQEENSRQQFEKAAVAGTVFQETDTCTERFMKKVCEYNVLFSPLLISLPLNLVAGRSMAFCIAMYCLALVFCLLFNLFKVHRACIEHKISRLFLESLWAVFAILLLVNIFITPSSTMPYLLTP